MSPLRSRAKRSSDRLSESRSARRMNSASVSGVSGLRSLSSYSSSSATSTPSGPGSNETVWVPRSCSSSTSSVCPTRAS